ncbi:hypothetical protein AB1285_26435 [Microbacterium sp. NRRL B-14842]
MDELNYRPKPWTPKDVPTIWVDQTTGKASPTPARPFAPSSASAARTPT